MPILEISFDTARGLLIAAGALAALALALFVGAGALFVAAKAWYRASKGELTSPPEDDEPPADAR